MLKRQHFWRDRYARNLRDAVIPNLANVLVALRHCPDLHGAFALDQMAGQIVVRRPLPPAGDGPPRPGGDRPMVDEDVAAMTVVLQGHELPTIRSSLVGEGINLVATENAFHPLREEIESVQHDGRPRVDRWLVKYLGAENTEYAREIGRMFLISAIARVYAPGCQADHALVLEGPQGGSKSTACAIIGGKYFSDQLPDVTSKDASIAVSAKWIIEIAELNAMRKAEVDDLKAFITRRSEIYRPPYGRSQVERPRSCVFIGTTNETSGYLRDASGGRRFWPIKVGRIDVDALRQDREQLLAEALALYRSNKKWWPDRSHAELLAYAQESRFEVDAWEDEIREYCNGRKSVTLPEVYGSIKLETRQVGTRERRRIIAIITRLDFKHGPKDPVNRRQTFVRR